MRRWCNHILKVLAGLACQSTACMACRLGLGFRACRIFSTRVSGSTRPGAERQPANLDVQALSEQAQGGKAGVLEGTPRALPAAVFKPGTEGLMGRQYAEVRCLASNQAVLWCLQLLVHFQSVQSLW